ncbi:helix-turn-helix XRE-family transcriptional regulators [Candidatus Termititenax persephonae]|uniref:Helix-turn-helix XRE-family transcriptional regulators n=1 Tax=Candidatus Termititenax persephonae TaxID=2218525 RepID=A0A388TFA1_9BACT|nr:helix-turn-helix XRE-family transcriptional regulators [Candidatus Termititenax persephonae]
MVKLYEWDTAKHLKNEAEIKEYLKVVLTDGNPELIKVALGNAARAFGILAISRKTGLNRSGLYHSLCKDGDPRLSTVTKVAGFLGYKLVFVPQKKQKLNPQTA